MNITKRLSDITPRPKMRISEIERQVRLHRIITPPPSRRAILKLCENGILETAPRPDNRGPYLIYEDSFLKWVHRMDRNAEFKMKR